MRRGADAASVFSFDVRDVARMRRDNRRGAEVVLSTAQELGLDPIVHVSSFVALLPSDGSLRRDSPLGRPNVPYARSKVETERIARDLQQAGAPVVITRPGDRLGPARSALRRDRDSGSRHPARAGFDTDAGRLTGGRRA
jgi:dihydroflavonol-4-reductase